MYISVPLVLTVEGVCFEAALQDNMSHFIIINAGGGSAGLLMAASLCTN